MKQITIKVSDEVFGKLIQYMAHEDAATYKDPEHAVQDILEFWLETWEEDK